MLQGHLRFSVIFSPISSLGFHICWSSDSQKKAIKDRISDKLWPVVWANLSSYMQPVYNE